MKRLWLWGPLALFAVFAGLFVSRLREGADTTIASHWVGQPMPVLDLPAAASSHPGLTTRDLADGKPKLVNIFASWCIPCAEEAGVLAQLRRDGVEVDGIALRDQRDDLDAFLARNGNPYVLIGADVTSSVAIALGSTGVPESYIVDGHGIIRHQYIGVLTQADVARVAADVKAAQ